MRVLKWQKWMIVLLFFCPLLTVPLPLSPACAEPAYAKWGRLAMRETQKKYPQAQIIDYLHVGRRAISAGTAEEVFKLWLRQAEREWAVYVRIRFVTSTDQVLSIRFEEGR